MNRRNLTIIVVIILALLAGGGYFVYTSFIVEPELSDDISNVAATIDNTGEGTQFRIDAEQSEVTFTLEEDLRGTRTTVVGTTNQVGGDIVINFAAPENSQVGTITINARSIATDNPLRNGQIRNSILQSANDDYEFITFTPTDLSGLPESVEIGDTYTFQIVGDLTIVETTNAVTFDTTVTIDSEEQISGSATATVLRTDFGLNIPNVPGVANVTDDVDLAINFVANAVNETE